MKTTSLTRWMIAFALSASSLLTVRSAAAAEAYARITGVHIERTNIVVEVEAGGALGKITLESSTRVGRRAWEPRAVQVLTNKTESPVRFEFEVPISPAIEILRVRGDFVSSTLPAEFYQGTNQFVAGVNGSAPGTGVFSPGVGTGAADRNSAPVTSPRDVVESDIWKLDGDTLYFFNQNRGLQVIDVSNPSSPAVTGTYPLAASGEQMYVIDHTNVVLLARDNCGWYGTGNDSRVLLLNVLNGEPRVVKELPVAGYISESRMVGSALYLVNSSYQQRIVPGQNGKPDTTEWQWGSEVVSFDLSQLATAERKSSDWVSGYGNVIYATDKYLFVAQQIYNADSNTITSLIHYYDISNPDGSFKKAGTIKTAGAVRDKFKMELNGDTFAVVTQMDWPAPRLTWVNTYSLADPGNPVELGRMKVVESEQLYATRFDGNRLYVVTFFQIDPLWIIDLSNPAQPKKVGELQIPGWSTFLQPLGDKLLAIGIDRTNGFTRTAVQLFNVADPAAPALLSKVLIGDQWSGSEANWDEKAFGVLPDDKLVLVPFYASGKDGYTQGVQLIDLEAEQLVKRGVVTQDMGARRATLHRGVLLSVSNSDLLSVDVADRDHPQVIQRTELSWAVDRVHIAGDYIIEVDAYRNGHPELRIVSGSKPELVLSTVALTNLPYLGSATADGQLYVLQGRSVEVVYPTVYNPTNFFPIATNPGAILMSKFDLTSLPEVRFSGQVVKETTNYLNGQYQALRVKPDLLVWHSRNSWSPIVYLDRGVADGVSAGPGTGAATPRSDVAVGSPAFRPIWPWWGGGSGHFIATSIGAGQPSFASELNVTGTNSWWGFGDSFTANGLLFTSHQASEWDPTLDPPPYVYSCYDASGTKIVNCTNDPPPGMWVTRYYLDVIDFNDAADPLLRKPVNIPGTLLGIDRSGELLFTRGYLLGPQWTISGGEEISASGYDGVEAHLISTLPLTNQWPRPAVVNAGYVYLGNAAAWNDTNATLQIWGLNASGKFELNSEKKLDSPAQTLALTGSLLILQETAANALSLYDPSRPADPRPVGAGRLNTCYGFNLDGADADLVHGLWVPASWYGVAHIPTQSGP